MILRNYAIGFGLAAVFTGLLIGFDVGHLRHLVLNVSGGYMALGLLFVFNGLVFAGAQVAAAVLLMTEVEPPRKRPPPRGGLRVGALAQVPAVPRHR
ncbi:hypothetical protein DXV76_05385 [Rhodobacteraceae bacterium CCMM004]|nr:hypothetical protein DXV76_05385 [Rhodobacteraceae bacterium CCMM004]